MKALKGNRKWVGLLLAALLVILTMSAMADTAAETSYAKADKTEVKVGETITVTYDFTALNAERTVKATRVEFKWVGSYPIEGQSYRNTRTLKEDTVTGIKGKLTFKVSDYDGDEIELYLNARPDDAFSVIWTEIVKIRITDAKPLTPVKMTVKPDQGSSILNQGDFKLNYEITGGTGDYSNLYCWLELQTADGKTTSTVYTGNSTLDKAKGSVEGELRAYNTMDTSVVYTGLVMKVNVTDRWGYTSLESGVIPLSYINVGQAGWVSKGGFYYYGDRNGHGYRGMITEGDKSYYLDENGRLQTGFFKAEDRWTDDLVWYYANGSGEILDTCEGMSSITVPAEVDAWPETGFDPFISEVDRSFVIYCTPGSFAERYAREKGLQYDNGIDHVVGYTIGDVNAKLNWIVDNYVTDAMSDRQKALVLHNWLIYNAHYDTSYSHYNADGVLVLGYGVCDSYSKAYQLLLTRAGIENIRVVGSANNSLNLGYEGHAWNLAKIDGTWYHIDTTWDDPIGGAAGEQTISGYERTLYFMKNDDFMSGNHRWSVGVVADGIDEEGDPGWASAGGRWYYYGEDRALVKGIVTIDGVTYGFEDTGRLADGWISVDGRWYATDANGVLIKNGWMQDGDSWYYMGKDGLVMTGLQTIDGTSYFFSSSGVMVTGWQMVNGQWYYFLSSGGMAHGWCQADGDWYYMDEDGVMVTGLMEIGGASYFFNASGVMSTGWAQDNGSWYYFKDDGSMAHGWCEADGSWYYFDEKGKMVTGLKKIGGVQYYFGTSGDMQTGWQQLGGSWYYFLDSGAMAMEWAVIDGNWEYFNADGTWSYTWGPVEE